MKKEERGCNISLMLLLIVLLGAILFLPGCKSITKSTRTKQVNIETELYGFKVTAFDPATGSSSPTGMFGWGKIFYRSIPMVAGQAFYVSHETYSLWGDKPASKTVIWVGQATEESMLKFTNATGAIIKVSNSGVESDLLELKVKKAEVKKENKEPDLQTAK